MQFCVAMTLVRPRGQLDEATMVKGIAICLGCRTLAHEFPVELELQHGGESAS